MAALHAGHNQALLDTVRLPHMRISADGVAIYATREDLEKNYLGPKRRRAACQALAPTAAAILLKSLQGPRLPLNSMAVAGGSAKDKIWSM